MEPERKEDTISLKINGGEYRNRTGVNGFAIRCVTTPPTRLKWCAAIYTKLESGATRLLCEFADALIYCSCRRLMAKRRERCP